MNITSWLWPKTIPACESISSGAQYATLHKNIFHHPSFVMYSVEPPPIKLKLGQPIGSELLIANHLGPIIMIGKSEILSSSQIVFYYTLLYRFTSLLRILTAAANHFPKPNPHVLTFLHPISLCRSHTEHCWRCSYIPLPDWYRTWHNL
jgi:hypothetical protein